MNFLAHLYLSGTSNELLLGNFIGDFVKGSDAIHLPQTIYKGVKLHHEIDKYMDTHALVIQGKDRLWNKYRHYARVIIDIYYDHFLAINWHHFTDEPLDDYAQRVYGIVESQWEHVPHACRVMFPYMVEMNWLLSYSEVDGIKKVLKGMSRRTSFVSRMDEASVDLVEHYDLFNEEFMKFFPQIVEVTKHYRDE